ncbi:hypothetical protein ACJX0J_031592, partial [Zea mays]
FAGDSVGALKGRSMTSDAQIQYQLSISDMNFILLLPICLGGGGRSEGLGEVSRREQEKDILYVGTEVHINSCLAEQLLDFSRPVINLQL